MGVALLLDHPEIHGDIVNLRLYHLVRKRFHIGSLTGDKLHNISIFYKYDIACILYHRSRIRSQKELLIIIPNTNCQWTTFASGYKAMRFVFINYRDSVGADHIAQGLLHGTEEREIILFLGILYKLY